MCRFNPETVLADWIETVSSCLDELQADRDDDSMSVNSGKMIEYAARKHLGILQDFYSDNGGASRFMSHTSCFCCLRELPEHPLICGHVLCTACVVSYAEPHDHGTYKLGFCPLHADDRSEPSLITLKPALAGVRVLCLDG